MKSTHKERSGKAIVMMLASLEAVVEKMVERRAARLGRPRWLRCSEKGVSVRQRPTLEPTVPFAKIGKVWFYDSIALDALVERQRAGAAAANDPAANDDAAEAMLAQIAGGGR